MAFNIYILLIEKKFQNLFKRPCILLLKLKFFLLPNNHILLFQIATTNAQQNYKTRLNIRYGVEHDNQLLDIYYKDQEEGNYFNIKTIACIEINYYFYLHRHPHICLYTWRLLANVG